MIWHQKANLIFTIPYIKFIIRTISEQIKQKPPDKKTKNTDKRPSDGKAGERDIKLNPPDKTERNQGQIQGTERRGKGGKKR